MSRRFMIRTGVCSPVSFIYRLPNLELFRVKSVPFPIIYIDERLAMAHGNTRTVAAIIEGQDSMVVEITDEKQDLEANKECINWCLEKGIFAL